MSSASLYWPMASYVIVTFDALRVHKVSHLDVILRLGSSRQSPGGSLLSARKGRACAFKSPVLPHSPIDERTIAFLLGNDKRCIPKSVRQAWRS